MDSICRHFPLQGHVISCHPFGGGHINRTFLAATNQSRLYILQEMNRHVFPDIDGVMTNMSAVLAHLHAKLRDPRQAMTLIPTREGRLYHLDGEGRAWRMLEYVTGGICRDLPESPEEMYQCGAAFGAFQQQLSDFPAHTLTEIIPHFHDTPDRYRQLHQAVRENRAGRLGEVQETLAALLAREEEAGTLMALLHAGRIPLRVTHNDTKLNNVMLDEKTGKPLCVMDLDTVMPGLAASDFGDAVRTGASTAAEDEQDLSRIGLDMEMYRAFAAGFLHGCGAILTEEEKRTLPWGARLMTLENAVRFMTDHLNGDVYFHIARPGHNLDRCRAQLALLQDMERKWEQMNGVIRALTDGQ